MKKFFLTVFTALMLIITVQAGEYYKPAEYLWYFESVDFTAGKIGVAPVCKVIAEGRSFPAVIQAEKIFKNPAMAGIQRCVMVFRQGITGKVIASSEFKGGNKWILPYLPADFYSVFIKCFDPDQRIVFSTLCCLNIVEDTTEQQIRLKPTVDKSIFSASISDDKLEVNGIPAKQENTLIHVIARTQSGGKLYEQEFKLKPKVTTGTCKLQELAPGQFISLNILLKNKDKVIDQTNIFYFRRGIYPASTPKWDTLPKSPPHTALTIHENQAIKGLFKDNQSGLNALVKGMKKRGSNMINLGFKWSAIEPVTGVYNWGEVDKYIKYFTDKKIRFGIIFGNTIFNTSPYDLWGEWMMSDKGNCRVWRKMPVMSPASEKFRTAIRNYVKAFIERYGKNPYFDSCVFIGQGLDSGLFQDHFNKVTDYSPWARKGFVAFLEKRYKSLEKLNSAWQTSYAKWSEITPPLPDWKKKVDISIPWIDFNAYKLKLYRDLNTGLYDPIVRARSEKLRVSHYLTYTGPIEYLFSEMQANNSHLNDGGGEAPQMVRLYSIAANWGIRRQPESHYVPASKRLCLQDMITNTLRYGFENYDLGMVWNSSINIHATHYPKNKQLKESMKFWTSAMPILRQLTQTTPLNPPVGFILSWDDVFYRTRAWRWYALPGNELQAAAGKVSLGNVPWLSGITPDTVYDRLKMLVCDYDNYVFSPELLMKLERFVKNGGTLALCGTAGEYTVGSKEKYLWRKRFNAPAKLNLTEITQWQYGKGNIIYSPVAASKPDTLVQLLNTGKIKRNVISSNPKIQGFLLQDGQDMILVISAFNGFDRLRKLKKFQILNGVISLPTLSKGKWDILPLYPSQGKNQSLNKNEISVEIEPSGIIIYRLKPKQKE